MTAETESRVLRSAVMHTFPCPAREAAPCEARSFLHSPSNQVVVPQ